MHQTTLFDQPEQIVRATQTAGILKMLQERQSGVTPMEALHAVGSFRLAAIIHTLRHRDGYNIKSEMVSVGNNRRVARYTLVK